MNNEINTWEKCKFLMGDLKLKYTLYPDSIHLYDGPKYIGVISDINTLYGFLKGCIYLKTPTLSKKKNK